MSPPSAVEIDSLVMSYGDTTAVDRLSLTVRTATITSVLGPNGAGKTTTVETCEGYRKPDHGTVRVLGLDPWRDGTALRPRIGVMLQDGAGFYPGARPVEMLTHLARLHAHPLDIAPLVERLNLGPMARTPMRQLSGGQRQRVALAAAIIGRPDVVFLDEPTAGLDPQARHTTWDLVRELRTSGVTVVLTTHLIDEAERLSDHVIIIDHGRLVTEGSPQTLTDDKDTGTVEFSGPPRLDLTSLRAALPESAVVAELTPGRYHVSAIVDPQLLATLTSWCATHDVMARGLTVGRRSLEDVFLDLTGKNLRT